MIRWAVAKAARWQLRGWAREERERSHVVVRRDSVRVGIVRYSQCVMVVKGVASVEGWMRDGGRGAPLVEEDIIMLAL